MRARWRRPAPAQAPAPDIAAAAAAFRPWRGSRLVVAEKPMRATVVTPLVPFRWREPLN